MRLVLMAMVVLGIGIWLSSWFSHDHGYLLLIWNDWRIEVSNLVVAVTLLIGGYLGFLWLISSISSRRIALAQRSLGSGLIELAQGRWLKAQRKLLRRVGDSQAPLLNYLGAARAAQMAGDDQNRDRHLAAALRLQSTASKANKIAVGLLRAETLHQSGLCAQAVEVLRTLQQLEPRHHHVLKLLQQIHTEQNDWQGMLTLLPQLRRCKLVSKQQSQLLSKQCHLELLKTADDIHVAWRHMPKKFTADAELFGYYLRVLIEAGQSERAGKLLTRRLKKGLDSRLLDLFGRLETGDLTAHYQLVEQWLKKSPEQPGLALAAGRLASKTGHLDAAIGYYERVVETAPTAVACQELADLFLQQKRQEPAIKWLKLGLDLAQQ